MIRPSLTLVLDLDEKLASDETIQELKRCYTYIGVPVIRSHASGSIQGAGPAISKVSSNASSEAISDEAASGAAASGAAASGAAASGENAISNDAANAASTNKGTDTHASTNTQPCNYARFIVSMGTHKYWTPGNTEANQLWTEVVEQWLGNMFHKIGSNMVAFNKRQRKIGLPSIVFDHIDVELEAGAFKLSFLCDPDSFIPEANNKLASKARNYIADGTLADVSSITLPSSASYAQQYTAAKEIWDAEHPVDEALEAAQAAAAKKSSQQESAPVVRPLNDEARWEADKVAKSYENTAVPPTDNDSLPPVEREEEPPELEVFRFEPNYSIWDIHFVDGSTRAFDSEKGAFL